MLTAVNGRGPSFFIARKWGRIGTTDLITLKGGAKSRGWWNEKVVGRGEERCRKRRDK
jgi:hypothetical protein